MKILQVKTFTPYVSLEMYKACCLDVINKRLNTLSMNEILKQYSYDDIKRAVNSIYLENNYICIPEYNQSSKILRLLQFGSNNIKALNILTLASVKMQGGRQV